MNPKQRALAALRKALALIAAVALACPLTGCDTAGPPTVPPIKKMGQAQGSVARAAGGPEDEPFVAAVPVKPVPATDAVAEGTLYIGLTDAKHTLSDLKIGADTVQPTVVECMRVGQGVNMYVLYVPGPHAWFETGPLHKGPIKKLATDGSVTSVRPGHFTGRLGEPLVQTSRAGVRLVAIVASGGDTAVWNASIDEVVEQADPEQPHKKC